MVILARARIETSRVNFNTKRSFGFFGSKYSLLTILYRTFFNRPEHGRGRVVTNCNPTSYQQIVCVNIFLL